MNFKLSGRAGLFLKALRGECSNWTSWGFLGLVEDNSGNLMWIFEKIYSALERV